MHFGNSEGKGGLKHGSRLWLGMDIFWNCPMETTSYDRAWRAFRKQNFGLGSTTFYLTVPITYTDADSSCTDASLTINR